MVVRTPESLDEYGLEPPPAPPSPTIGFDLGDGTPLTFKLGDRTALRRDE